MVGTEDWGGAPRFAYQRASVAVTEHRKREVSTGIGIGKGSTLQPKGKPLKNIPLMDTFAPSAPFPSPLGVGTTSWGRAGGNPGIRRGERSGVWGACPHRNKGITPTGVIPVCL
jgi:hypothetical protein